MEKGPKWHPIDCKIILQIALLLIVNKQNSIQNQGSLDLFPFSCSFVLLYGIVKLGQMIFQNG